jgi:hypothetical protein
MSTIKKSAVDQITEDGWNKLRKMLNASAEQWPSARRHIEKTVDLFMETRASKKKAKLPKEYAADLDKMAERLRKCLDDLQLLYWCITKHGSSEKPFDNRKDPKKWDFDRLQNIENEMSLLELACDVAAAQIRKSPKPHDFATRTLAMRIVGLMNGLNGGGKKFPKHKEVWALTRQVLALCNVRRGRGLEAICSEVLTELRKTGVPADHIFSGKAP